MKKILVVEDEPTLREGVVTAFTQRGWQVIEAADGAEALATLEGEVFDVVVTDFKMPEGSGLDVLRHTKMLNEGTVVLMHVSQRCNRPEIARDVVSAALGARGYRGQVLAVRQCGSFDQTGL